MSVIVPTHSRPQLLARALTSIARQTLVPVEVLIVDDVGDDETRELVASQESQSTAPMRHLHNEQAPGACGSRNLGASVATGDLLAFLDDDDEWFDTFLERCVSALAQGSADFAVAELDRTLPDGTVKRLTTRPGLTARNVLHQRVCMTGSSFVARKEAFWSVGGFDRAVPVFNDWDLFIRLVRAGKSYEVVQEPLVRWIEHAGDRITTPTLRRADGIDRFLRVYGRDMRFHVRGYFLRIAYGIRKANEGSRLRRLALTSQMLRSAGVAGATYILWRSLANRLARSRPS